jgi:hypothetical protein
MVAVVRWTEQDEPCDFVRMQSSVATGACAAKRPADDVDAVYVS